MASDSAGQGGALVTRAASIERISKRWYIRLSYALSFAVLVGAPIFAIPIPPVVLLLCQVAFFILHILIWGGGIGALWHDDAVARWPTWGPLMKRLVVMLRIGLTIMATGMGAMFACLIFPSTLRYDVLEAGLWIVAAGGVISALVFCLMLVVAIKQGLHLRAERRYQRYHDLHTVPACRRNEWRFAETSQPEARPPDVASLGEWWNATDADARSEQ